MMTHLGGDIARTDAELADVVRRQVRAGHDAGATDREIRYTALHDYYTTLAV
jgi:cytochrome c-type biogenesis protein CcmH/NrfF